MSAATERLHRRVVALFFTPSPRRFPPPWSIEKYDDKCFQEKADELSQKITVLAGTLGPEYVALVHSLQETEIDPKSRDAQEIGSILIALDQLCEG